VEPSAGLRERILTAASSARAAQPLDEGLTRGHPALPPTAVLPPAARVLQPGRRWREARALVALAAVLVVVVGGALVAWSMPSQNDATAARARSAALASVVGQIASGAPVVHLASTAAAPGASGVAVIARTGVGYLVIGGLPPAPAGRIYEAWFISGGSPRPAGLFDIEADGLGIIAGMPAGGRVDAVAVTQEPAGGSSRPTGAILAAGAVAPAASP
jgi:anti-sigma-K factor RskA